ncbi:MAG: hypothetical protein ACRERC_26925 [Candidatus Binatia bacterium]
MLRRIALVTLAVVSLGLVGTAGAQTQTRPAVDRPEIQDVGDAMLINRQVLRLEMKRNSDLRDWVRLYGLPDYAEVQQITIDPPWAPYEVRLYYIDGNAYIAFSRVNVAPNLYDYGVRKYIGPINAGELDRLLTAEPVEPDEVMVTVASSGPQSAPPLLVETLAVDGVPIAN